jgi:diphosphomevalonate decarboxylase
LPSSQSQEFILDGAVVPESSSARVFNYVRLLQKRYGLSGSFRVESENHVPISAGLASSSSAFSALAAAFAGAYQLNATPTELSRMARLGSGSAARSIYGGFAKWERGTDDSTSIAVPLDEHPSMDVNLIAVEIDASRKTISSTAGMKRVVETSPYYPTWVSATEAACTQMEEAIAAEDFTRIGTLAQQSALDMHALNMTAHPGFTYFQPSTLTAMSTLDELNDAGVECYYTMDAGPNVKVLARSGNVEEIGRRLGQALPAATMTTTSFGPGVENLS